MRARSGLLPRPCAGPCDRRTSPPRGAWRNCPTPSFRSILRPLKRSSVASAIRAQLRARPRPLWIPVASRHVHRHRRVDRDDGAASATARRSNSCGRMTRWSGAGSRRTVGARSSIPATASWPPSTSVANSVRAAADIQRRFAAYNADASETLSVRIGIDAGEPVEDHNDLFGVDGATCVTAVRRSRGQRNYRFRDRCASSAERRTRRGSWR